MNTVLTCETSSWTVKEKFHISKQPCIILFIIQTPYWLEDVNFSYIVIDSWH